MIIPQSPLVGYGGYTAEERHTIAQRAHRERAQALRAFFTCFTWLFAPRKASARDPKRPANLDAVACS